MTSAEAVIRWWLAFSLVSLAFAPLTWWLAAGLGQYRHALLRPVGLVVATFVVWWPAAMFGLPFQTETVLAGIFAGGLASWILIVRYRRDLMSELRTLVVFELVWIVSLVGYVAFRSANPDIANTEKPMEIALLSSIARSREVLAPDPWFAGSPINYYYFGYQSIATLIHLSGLQASIAFNLALSSLFASTLTVASGFGGWLAERFQTGKRSIVASGALAAFFVGLAGNLETFTRLVTSPGETISAGWWDGVGWQASRVIVDSGANGNPTETINEFPAFAFVLGDLHPHLTTLPVLLATIMLAAGLANEHRFTTYARVGAVGAFAGLLYASNSWDAPVGVVCVLGAVALGFHRIDRDVAWRWGVAIAGAALAALPFAISYTAPVGVQTGDIPGWLTRLPVLGSLPNTIAVVTWRPSSAAELLVVHGVWIIIGILYIGWVYATSIELRNTLRQHVGIILPCGLVLAAGAIAWSPAIVLLGFPAVVLLATAWLERRRPVRLAAALFAAGFWLAMVPEFLYIQDSFGNRMNTVFKLNFQAWVFFGVASAVAVVIVAREAQAFRRVAAVAAVSFAVLAAAPYTPLSVADWMDMGTVSGTLDGAVYLNLTNPSESAGIAWLDAEARDGDVIVEAPGCAYQTLHGVPMNRFSAFTGTPTLLGWANHERQWRRSEFSNLSEVIGSRESLATSWLSGQPAPTPADIEPDFIIFGAIERSTSERCPMLTAYGDAEIELLVAQGWAIGFQEGETTILRRD
ncbi:hypothetical protein BH23CHL2_BH23CHL2_18280 [soil metagenome]